MKFCKKFDLKNFIIKGKITQKSADTEMFLSISIYIYIYTHIYIMSILLKKS